jgi:hypothetical protein
MFDQPKQSALIDECTVQANYCKLARDAAMQGNLEALKLVYQYCHKPSKNTDSLMAIR